MKRFLGKPIMTPLPLVYKLSRQILNVNKLETSKEDIKKIFSFKILAVAPDLVSLRILESLRIFKSKPKLNDSNSSFPLNIVH